MPRHLPAFVVILSFVDAGAGALAQTPVRIAEGLGRPVALVGAGIQGVVRDEAGQAVGDVSILAMGATLAAVRTDSRGRFLLLLAPGEYILRAVREGYLSTVREAIRVLPPVPIERNITITRLSSQPGSATSEQPPGAAAEPADHAHTELAWRLRHMTRSVLRDDGAVPMPAETDRAAVRGVGAKASLLDWVVGSSARAATSFLVDTDFRGQVHFLTMSLVPGDLGETPVSVPRGSASAVVGAPVGSHGDWSVRAAMAADDLSSWTLAGDYQTRASRVHAFRLGVSYSSQTSVTARAALPSIAAPGSRRVGGAYVFDAWRARPDVVLEYGLRFDRYDYLAETALVSPRVGARITAGSATITAAASRRLVAPGAEEFLAPATSGLWLPPQRTFSTLSPDASLHPETIDRAELGLEYAVSWPTPTVLRFSRFIESVDGQIATLFGLDAESEVGHYYVTTAGSPQLEAWVIGLDSEVGPYARAAIEYTAGQTRWRGRRSTNRAVLFAGARPRFGRVHDVTLSAEGVVPGIATRVAVAYRLNTYLLRDDRPDRPAAGGRFNLEIRQQLPYKPIRGGTLDLVLGVRTLFGEIIDHASFFDELLTVAPPTRVVCGVQVGF